MKLSRKYARFAILVSLSIGLVAGAYGQSSAYTDGGSSGISAADLRSLRAIKGAVAVPTLLPAGYELKQVDIQAPEAHIIAFTLVYANAQGDAFKIESNNEALGDMAVRRQVKGTTNLFRDPAQETGVFYTGRDRSDSRTVASEWLCSTKKYQPKGAIPQCFQFLSESSGVTPAMAMKVMSSLRYLSR